MEKLYISIDEKDYQVNEPTIQDWAKLNLMKDIGEEKDFVLNVLSISTGVEIPLLEQANYIQVREAADYLIEYFLSLNETFYQTFDFEDVKYRFIDINNLSFGQFVDIDEFLKRDEHYKRVNMNELMAMLYQPIDQEKYDASLIPERARKFKKLPVKYLQGSLLFFLNLRKRLLQNTPYYLRLIWKVKRIMSQLSKRLAPIGVGMRRLYFWRKRT